jgi:hypothetical protein
MLLGEDRDEQVQKEHITKHRHDRRDSAARETLVVAQVARVREPQEGPPYGIAELRGRRVGEQGDRPRDQGYDRDDRGRKEQARVHAA